MHWAFAALATLGASILVVFAFDLFGVPERWFEIRGEPDTDRYLPAGWARRRGLRFFRMYTAALGLLLLTVSIIAILALPN